MTIASAFNEIAVAQGGAASKTGSIAGAIDALNDALAGSDQQGAETIEDAVRLLGDHIGGGPTPSGTIEITENGEGIDVASYAYADVSVSGGSVDVGDPVLVTISSVIPAIGDEDSTSGFVGLDSFVVSIAVGSSSIMTVDSVNNYGEIASGTKMTVGNYVGVIKVYDCTRDDNFLYTSVTEITGKVTDNGDETSTIEIPSVSAGHYVVVYITAK